MRPYKTRKSTRDRSMYHTQLANRYEYEFDEILDLITPVLYGVFFS